MNVIWDIDGTIADGTKFEKYIKNDPKDWDRWIENLIHHDLHEDMVELYHMYHRAGHKNYVCTARRENCRLQTEAWFEKHGLHMAHNGIYMRQMNDYRPDFEVKEEMLLNFKANGIIIHKAYEDRISVVEMFRRNGVRCLHVSDGYY